MKLVEDVVSNIALLKFLMERVRKIRCTIETNEGGDTWLPLRKKG